MEAPQRELLKWTPDHAWKNTTKVVYLEEIRVCVFWGGGGTRQRCQVNPVQHERMLERFSSEASKSIPRYFCSTEQQESSNMLHGPVITLESSTKV